PRLVLSGAEVIKAQTAATAVGERLDVVKHIGAGFGPRAVTRMVNALGLEGVEKRAASGRSGRDWHDPARPPRITVTGLATVGRAPSPPAACTQSRLA